MVNVAYDNGIDARPLSICLERLPMNELPVVIAANAVPALLDYLHSHTIPRVNLVADGNTWRVLGERTAQALTATGIDVKPILLAGEEVTPDEQTVVEALLGAGREQRLYLAVGSGTVTDVTRFTSYCTGNDFISLPTAPSVDAYTSTGSSLIVRGLKQTIYAHAPVAVFADLDTLCAAPKAMIAAGFGDVVAKYTSVADWKLAALLWDGPYDDAVARRMAVARDRCMAQVDPVGAAEPEGIRSLIDALIEAGLCMLAFGGSQPAGQSEHYISHYLEMKLVREGRKPVLHGAKTGMATVIIARYYQQIRQMSRDEAARRLAASTRPDRDAEVERIRFAYGDLTDAVIAEQAAFLDWSDADYERLKQRILDRWPQVQAVAAEVPPPDVLTDLLERAGGTADYRALGLGDEELALAEVYGHYVRNRFTAMKLSRVLGLLG
jgi:glycerol-1-phosphate dehydrogenase [NAD(P)+]